MRKIADVGEAEASFAAGLSPRRAARSETGDAPAAEVEIAASAAHRPSGRRARRTSDRLA
jgi:hypothetical protein